jgi:tetratricopeptide (TPR) repeat protein
MNKRFTLLIVCICVSTFLLPVLAQNVKVSSDSLNTILFNIASIDFMKGDYYHAAMSYQALLDLEKENPTLEKAYWYVLIDNLGMAYGIPGNLEKAEEIFKYGVSKDSTYPMFYYNLACTYAEREDMDNAIRYLKTAYKFKSNMLPGEPFPDPMVDDSFKRFLKNDKFIEAIKEMKQK